MELANIQEIWTRAWEVTREAGSGKASEILDKEILSFFLAQLEIENSPVFSKDNA